MQEKFTVDDKLLNLLERTCEIVMESEQQSDAELSLVLVDDSFIRELNNDYRGIDAPTDVLSFSQLEDAGDPLLEPVPSEKLLGDVVISLERAASQATEYGHSFEREVAFLAVHGVLHLTGYDHQNEDERMVMRKKEEAFLARLGLARDNERNE